MTTKVVEGFHLSPLQERLWKWQRSAGVRWSQISLELDPGVSFEGLQEVLGTLVERYEILRTSFKAPAGVSVPLQVIDDARPPCLERLEFDSEKPPELAALLLSERQAVRQEDSGSGLRAGWFDRSPAASTLILTAPLMCLDRYSLRLLANEILLLLAAGQGATEDADEILQYADFAEWHNELLQGEEAEQGKAFWQQRREIDAAGPRLLFETEVAAPAAELESVTRQLDRHLVAVLDRQLEDRQLEWSALLLAAWRTLLWRLSGDTELVLGWLLDGRKYDDLATSLGLFERSIPIAATLRPGDSLLAFAKALGDAGEGVFEWMEYFAGPPPSAAEGESGFGFGFEFDEPQDGGAMAGIGCARGLSESFKLLLGGVRSGPVVDLRLSYDGGRFPRRVVERIVDSLLKILTEVAATPSLPIERIDGLPSAERQRLVASWNQTASEFPQLPLHELFRQRAEQFPEVVAVLDGRVEISYGVVSERAHRLAHHLLRRGVRREDRIVLLLERGVDQIIALLAVHEAGAAFVPLDADQPVERLRQMLADIEPRLVILEGGAGAELVAADQAVDLRRDQQLIAACSAISPTLSTAAEQLAYVLFTSGSTGRPKGTMVRHSSVTNLTYALEQAVYADRTGTLRISLNAPLSFDASIKQLVRLAWGDTLCIIPQAVRPDGEALLRLLTDQQIDLLDATPGQLRLLLAAGLDQAELPLAKVLLGGEGIDAGLWGQLVNLPRLRVFNVYGPTECTVDSTLREVAARPSGPSLGRPLANIQVYVLDRRSRLTHQGIDGELAIAGAGVARGYLGRPALTAERFVPDPFAAAPGSRLYRSGDRVCHGEDGELEFLGRVDRQIKLRGFRIELGEIESVLRQHPAISESAVQLRHDRADDPRLVAYVAGASTAADDPDLHTLPNGLVVAHQNRNETDYLYQEIFANRCYTLHGITLPENACVFDIGANIGMFTLFVSRACPTARIFAFEPLPPIYLSLRRNVARHASGTRLFEYGLSASECSETFTFYPRYTMMSGSADYANPEGEVEVIKRFLSNELEQGEAAAGELLEQADELLAGRFREERHSVRLRRLSEVISEQGIDRIDLLKIDVQRAEMDVLAGLDEADWDKVQQVVMEVHDAPDEATSGRVEELRELLSGHGFEVVVEQDQLLTGTDRYNLYASRPGIVGPAGERLAELAMAALPEDAAAVLEADQLRAFLAQRLPDFMLPSAIVPLPFLPLDRRGKIDWSSLPAPEEQQGSRRVIAPRTPFEELMVSMWCDILGVDQVSVDDSFFEIGGHSLLATQLVSRVRRGFHVELPLRRLFEEPTVEGLAGVVEELLQTGGEVLPPIEPRAQASSTAEDIPLSFAQQRLWFLDRLKPGNTAYNSMTALALEGQLDPALVVAALSAVVGRHESLRTVFPDRHGEPRQQVLPAVPFDLPLVDLAQLSATVADAEVRRRGRLEAATPFDLGRGPLIRAQLLRLGEARHVVLFSLHHIVADGWSMGVLIRELSEFYAAFAGGRPAALAELPIQYGDYAIWQRGWLAGEILEERLGYWRQQLAGLPELLELPTDRPRPAVQTFRGAVLTRLISSDTAAVQKLAASSSVTPYMILLAVFKTVLWRYTGQTDLSVGTAVANRHQLETEGLIGFLVNTLVLRTELAERLPFSQLLDRLREVVLDAHAHQDVPFEKLVEELRPSRSLSHSPLFQVGFDLQPPHGQSLRLAGIELQRLELGGAGSKFDLTVTLDQAEGRFRAGAVFNPDLFDRTTIQRLLDHFDRVLQAVLRHPDSRLDQLPVLNRGQRHQLLWDWNDTAVPYGADSLLGPLLARRADCGSLQAVAQGAVSWSYAELWSRVDQLSSLLRSRGMVAETRVGLSSVRSPEMVVGLLAILSGGGTVVPLDPDYPAARLSYLIEDSGASLLLVDPAWTTRPQTAGLSGDLPVIELHQAVAGRHQRAAPAVAVAADQLAYVIYTSGSTGRPKGVMVSHRAIANRVLWMQSEYPLAAADRVLQKTPLSFDASLWELLTPLVAGASIELARDGGHRDMAYLRQLIEERGVSVLQLVPSQLQVWLEEVGAASCGSLRRVFSGGEALPEALRGRFESLLDAELINLYGPTETAIDASHNRCRRGQAGTGQIVPIGRPLGNLRLSVLDGGLESLPVAAAGELYVAGPSLARGYQGRAALTAERFVPDPWSPRAGGRLYRTGDRGRRLADGRLEYLGRADQQIKVRGVRIEPGEIEARLTEHPAIEGAAVVARGSGADKTLVAYVATRGSTADAAVGSQQVEIWPCVGEYQIYEELLYYSMVKDERRNQLYRRAIQATVAGKVVLDVGTGHEAIWARYCAAAGARRVYALEIVEEAADHARQRIASEGLQDIVEVIHGDISQVDLAEKVEVCVSNLIGTLGGSEGAAVLLRQARRLMAPGGIFVPRRCVTRIAAVSLPEAVRRQPGFVATAVHYVERVFAEIGYPFDLRLCLRHLPSEYLLSAPGIFEELDFQSDFSAEFERRTILKVEHAGRCDGFLAWIELETAECLVIDSLRHEHSWLPVFIPAAESLELEAGDTFELTITAVLEADGIHPDYRLRGHLARPGSEPLPIELDSPFRRPGLGRSEFYRRLFPDAAPRLLAEPRGVGELTAKEVREHLEERLPPALVPTEVVFLDILPRTVGGKIDRQALVALAGVEDSGAAAPSTAAAPRSLLEEQVLDIWRGVLRVDSLGIHDDFFDHGGHSLLATRIISRVRRACDAAVEVRDLFEAPTVAELVRRLERTAPLPPLPPMALGKAAVGGRRRASFAQERMWLLQQLEPESASYNTPVAVAFEGRLEVAVLAESLRQLAERHQVLAARLVQIDGEIWQQAGADGLRMPLVDLQALRPADAELEAHSWLQRESARPFDLGAEPAARALLFRLGEERYQALLNCHHAVSDAWSMGILIRELAAFYRALAQAEPVALPPLRMSYSDFADWQRELLSGARLEAQLGYWLAQLDGAGARLDLPTDRPRPRALSDRGVTRRVSLPPALSAELLQLARQQGVTAFMLLLAAFETLLHRYTGQTDLCVGVPIAGRQHLESESLIGLFVNTLVMRGRFAGDPGFDELLLQVRRTALDAHTYQDLPFERLIEELLPRRDLSRTPLFQVMFELAHEASFERFDLPAVELHEVVLRTDTAKLDLAISMAEKQGGLVAAVQYSSDLFDHTTIERLWGHLGSLLRGIVASPTTAVSALPLLSPAERHQLAVEWNATEVETGFAGTILELFASHVDQTPSAIAVADGSTRLTYRELDRCSNAVAWTLVEQGVEREMPVALCARRRSAYLVALVGILKAGAVYLPLGPKQPTPRLLGLVERSRVAVLLIDDRRAELAEAVRSSPQLDTAVLVLDELVAAQRWSPPARPIDPSQLAYVLFTSGSTGLPKAAMLDHRGLLNQVWAKICDYRFSPSTVVAQSAAQTFDVSVWQLLAAILAGGRTEIFDDRLAFDPSRLLGAIEQRGVTILEVVPSFLRYALEELDGAGSKAPRLTALEWLMSSGEAIAPELCRRWLRRYPRIPIINAYGPAECSDNISQTFVRKIDDCRVERIVVGRPIANIDLSVLDRQLRRLPVGVVGELFASGVGVGRGYLAQPGRTAEVFIPDPYGEGQRLYRTGDLVKYCGDGNLDFLGRVDFQVKVRGQRIEPGEVDAVLQRQPEVVTAVTIARPEVGGSLSLMAFVVLANDAQVSAEELRKRVAASLPEAMVPSVVTVLERLPLNANGKIDRAALAALELAAPSTAATGGWAGGGFVEDLVSGIWSEVLALGEIGRQDDFFALGGHSLLATRVLSRLRKVLGVELELRAIFEDSTLAGFARRVAMARVAGEEPPAVPLQPVERGAGLALSFAQQRMWFIQQLDPQSSAYNIPFALELEGALDPRALRQAINQLRQRHETLRTRFALGGGGAVQVVEAALPLDLPLIDLSALSEPQRSAAARRHSEQLNRRPYDLSRAPLLRLQILRLGATQHWVVATIHHIAADGWSVSILIDEVAKLYEAAVAGRAAILPALPIQYADFAVWQRQWLSGAVLERQLEYWRSELAGAPALLDLPLDRPRPASWSFAGGSYPVRLPKALSEAARELGRSHGATPFMVLLTAFQTLLFRLSGQDDILLGTPIAGRRRLEVEGLIGLFVNTLVLRGRFGDQLSFGEALTAARETALAADAHQDLPFERLVDELQLVRDLAYSPLFQTMFAFQNVPGVELEVAELVIKGLQIDSQSAKFDLTLGLQETAAGVVGDLQYATDLFDRSTIARWVGQLEQLLAAAVAEPDRALTTLSLLSEAERQELVVEWSGQGVTFEFEGGLWEAFATTVELQPQAIAVNAGEVQLTYLELRDQAAELAGRLWAYGVRPGQSVGLFLERDALLVVAILATLRCAAVYVPIDPEVPAERLRFLAEDSACSLLLTSSSLRDRLPPLAGQVIEIDAATGPNPPTVPAWVTGDPGHAAYVIYTSGSTGVPKGVVVAHDQVLRLLRSSQQHFGFAAEDVWTLFHSYAFDVSVWEIWGALLHGGRLVVVPYWVSRSPDRFLELLQTEGVTVLSQTPSAFRQLISAESTLDRAVQHTLRYVVFAGEALDPSTLRGWLDRHGDSSPRLINMYGITETTVHSTFHRISAAEISAGFGSNVGRPLADLRIFLLDRRGHPVPQGVGGELVVGGAGVALGYLGRGALTASRFVPDALGGGSGARLYRSGDLARWLADGDLEYLGRIDQQVKVRGFRIEPGEIEALLREQPQVAAAAVMALREAGSADARLVAYLVAAADQELRLEELRQGLGERLPSYMVPAEFVVLERLPLTSNGKLDRRALPRPKTEERLAAETSYLAPETPVEHLLTSIWEEVLGLEKIGVEDNFFVLGGDSIQSIQIVAKVNEAGLKIAPRHIFLHQNIAELARVAESLGPPIADRGPVSGPVQLTPIQHWFFDQQLVEVDHFNQALMLEVRERLDPKILRRVFDTLVEHHDGLRLRFVRQDAGWQAHNLPPGEAAPFSVLDLSAVVDEQHPPAELLSAAADRAQRALNLGAGPLARVIWLDLGAERSSRLLLIIHHLAVDGISWRILLADLQRVYQQLAAGQPARLPPRSSSYQAWAERLTALAGSEALVGDGDFWLSRGQSQAGRLPRIHRASTHSEAGQSTTVSLDPEQTEVLLHGLPEDLAVQTQEILLAAILEALATWMGSRIVQLDLEGHGREDVGDDIDVTRTVGWFTTIYPVSFDLRRCRQPMAILRQVRERLRSVPRRGLSFGLLRYLRTDESGHGIAAIAPSEVLFNYLGQLDRVLEAESSFVQAAESTGPQRSPLQKPSHSLEITAKVADGRLTVSWNLAGESGDHGALERVAGGFLKQLGKLIDVASEAERPEPTPADFPLAKLDAGQLENVLGRFGKVGE